MAEWDSETCAHWLRHHDALPLARRFLRERLDGLDLLAMAATDFRGQEGVLPSRAGVLAAGLRRAGGERQRTVGSVMRSFKSAGDSGRPHDELDDTAVLASSQGKLHRTPTLLRLALDDIHNHPSTHPAAPAATPAGVAGKGRTFSRWRPARSTAPKPIESAGGFQLSSYLGDSKERLHESAVLRIRRNNNNHSDASRRGKAKHIVSPTVPSPQQEASRMQQQALDSPSSQRDAWAQPQAAASGKGNATAWGLRPAMMSRFGGFCAAVSVENLLMLDSSSNLTSSIPNCSSDLKKQRDVESGDEADSPEFLRRFSLRQEQLQQGPQREERQQGQQQQEQQQQEQQQKMKEQEQQQEQRQVEDITTASVPANVGQHPKGDDRHAHLTFALSDNDRLTSMMF